MRFTVHRRADSTHRPPVRFKFTFAMAAYNLIRMPSCSPQREAKGLNRLDAAFEHEEGSRSGPLLRMRFYPRPKFNSLC